MCNVLLTRVLRVYMYMYMYVYCEHTTSLCITEVACVMYYCIILA